MGNPKRITFTMYDGYVTVGKPDDWENIAIGPKFAIEPSMHERYKAGLGIQYRDVTSAYAGRL